MANELDFIGIGFRRCGSSWLHQALSQHPDICKPIKGVHFFSDELLYAKGKYWYLNQIEQSGNFGVTGEFSVSYSYPENCELTAKRMKETFPDVKVFAVVRNPVDRAFSDFNRSIQKCEIEKTSFLKAISDNPEFLDRGRYQRNLYHFHKFFGDNLKVFFYDDLEKNPAEFICQFYSWLGVDEKFVPSVVQKQLGHARQVRSIGAQKVLMSLQAHVSRKLRAVGFGWLLSVLKNSGFRDRILALNYEQEEALSKKTRKQLVRFFEDDIDKVSQLTGRNLSDWKK